MKTNRLLREPAGEMARLAGVGRHVRKFMQEFTWHKIRNGFPYRIFRHALHRQRRVRDMPAIERDALWSRQDEGSDGVAMTSRVRSGSKAESPGISADAGRELVL